MFNWISKLSIKGRQSSRTNDDDAPHFGVFLFLRVYPCFVSVFIGAYAAYFLAVHQDTNTVSKELLFPSAVAVGFPSPSILRSRI
jgi:hypothetical protein